MSSNGNLASNGDPAKKVKIVGPPSLRKIGQLMDDSNGNSTSNNPADVIIQNVTKLLQKKQGCLPLQKVLEYLLKTVTVSCSIFEYSSEGLRQFLTVAIFKGPAYFPACIIDNDVYLVSVYGKKRLKSKLQESPNAIICVEETKSVNSVPKPKPQHRKMLSIESSAKLVIALINILERKSDGIPIEELYSKLLGECGVELEGTELESSLVNFKQFILNHNAEFSLSANKVKCLVGTDSDAVSQAVLAVKMTVWLKGGSVNIKNLPGHFSAFPTVRQVTGGSKESLQKFLSDHSSVFNVSPSGEVTVIDSNVISVATSSNISKPPSQASVAVKPSKKKVVKETKLPPTLTKMPLLSCRSVTVTVLLKFGFIHFGTKEDENIYFDSNVFVHTSHSAPVEEIDDLKKYIKVGDAVDCLFIECEGHKTKHKALVVWKIPNGIDNDLCLTPIIELPSKVLLGSAAITFLSGEIGSCKVVEDRKESLIEFEPRNKMAVTSVGFHLGWTIIPKPFIQPLKLKKVISFVAKPMLNLSGQFSSNWIAVSVWEKTVKKKSNSASETGKRVIKAEVRELTSEGGLMSFGSDPWAHRATFQWQQLGEALNGFLTFSVGDVFWCVISESKEPFMGSTKWVVSQLVPYDPNDNDKPPLHFRNFQCETLESEIVSSTETLSILDTTNIEIPEVKSASVKVSDVTDAPTLLERDLPDFLNFLTGSVGITSSVQITDVNESEPIVVENGLGMLVSKDAYGGMLEGDGGTVVYFGAHSFFLNNRPISHLAFPERTTVHFEAKANPKEEGTLIAEKVWIGKKPSKNN